MKSTCLLVVALLLGCGTDDSSKPKKTADDGVSGDVASGDVPTADEDATATGEGTADDVETPEDSPQPPDQDTVVRTPTGGWTAVTCGSSHSCGIRNQAIECWGAGKVVGDQMALEHGQSIAPDGTFTALDAASGDYTCALRTDGTVTCWGLDIYFSGELATGAWPSGKLATISSGWHHACGLETQPGPIKCWGLASVFEGIPAGDFTEVTVGQDFACALDGSGLVTCWGMYDVNTPTDPGTAFRTIDAGPSHVCGIRSSDDHVECWGGDDANFGQWDAPDEAFSEVSASAAWSCGILKANGKLSCWGSDDFGLGYLVVPQSGGFSGLSAGQWHGCAIAADSTLTCWGSNGHGRATPP